MCVGQRLDTLVLCIHVLGDRAGTRLGGVTSAVLLNILFRHHRRRKP